MPVIKQMFFSLEKNGLSNIASDKVMNSNGANKLTIGKIPKDFQLFIAIKIIKNKTLARCFSLNHFCS